jgi:hypothetical protein
MINATGQGSVACGFMRGGGLALSISTAMMKASVDFVGKRFIPSPTSEDQKSRTLADAA